MITLSSKEAREMLSLFLSGSEARVSLDLGKTKSDIRLEGESVIFPGDERVGIKFIKKIAKEPKDIFLIDKGEVMKATFFSDESNKFYKLRPTATWPALEISGILMHRVAGTDPKESAEKMVAAIMPACNVLDTCCGLGYTAIIAARDSASVNVFESDENVIDLIKVNPYSQELFTNKKITFSKGDILEEIKKFKGNSFDAVLHDPPSISIAGELYSSDFYLEVLRVLKPRGRFFHYTGDTGKKRGADLPGSVANRLRHLGFSQVVEDKDTLAVLARKP